jgi:hypothetical protein
MSLQEQMDCLSEKEIQRNKHFQTNNCAREFNSL